MVVGTELYLELGRWPLLFLVAAGLALIGWPKRVDGFRHLTLNLLTAISFSMYLTLTAFYRYRGLSKDLEPTITHQATYFLKIATAVLLLLSILTMIRAGAARFRRSRTPTVTGS